MGEFMGQCGSVAFGVVESFKRWHLHEVRAFGVVSTGATITNIGAGGSEEPIGGCEASQRSQSQWLGLDCVVSGQAFALLGVENGVTFEEGDFAFAHLTARIGLGARDTIGINDKLAGLALADIAAKCKGLFEGQP
jgi:hypothetical protein